jgi:phospholipase C
MSMQNIEHIVLLMLENQSFDSLLGWLYENGEKPSVNIPPAVVGDEFRGLYGVDPSGFVNTAPNGLQATPTRGAEGFTVPTPDPGEEFEHVNVQLFDTTEPAPGATATMTGVLADYVGVMQSFGYTPQQIATRAPSILQSYTPAQLPVLNQLARHYAVCDAWFSSVPSQTNPNRSFALTGTSYGLVNNGELESNPQAKLIEKVAGLRIGDDCFPQQTIFNALQSAGRSWSVFWQTSYLPQKISSLLAGTSVVPNPVVQALLLLLKPYTEYLTQLSSGDLSSVYTWRLFQAIQSVPGAASHFGPLAAFHQQARAGTLPAFSYIEPFWTMSQNGTDTGAGKRLVTAMGNDYHPPSNKLVGEAFVRSVYESLVANPTAWSKTLLIISFDEPVGSFDHVPPPAAVPPWGKGGTPPFASDTGFGFDRLGGRVPTILVSPWVRKSTVFRSTTGVAYDHTSIVSTVLGWAAVADPQRAVFGERAAAAPTFEGVLTMTTPRTDANDLPFLHNGGSLGAPLHYGDMFVLRNQNGNYLGGFVAAPKTNVTPGVSGGVAIDLGLAAYFPTLGSTGVPLMFQCRLADPGPVNDGDSAWLVSTEVGLVADNVLGAWADSHDCYWYDLYLDGPEATKQVWTIRKAAGGPIAFGDPVRLVNASYGQGLSHDSRPFQSKWITTSGDGEQRTVLPCPPH